MAIQGEPLDLPAWEEANAGGRRPSLGRWVHLVLACARRRKFLAVTLFVAGLAATVAYYGIRATAPTWRVEAQVLAQRQQALPSVVRTVFDNAPTRAAWELVHRRDNLIALLKRAGVPAASAERAARSNEEDPLDLLVAQLDKRLLVTVDEGTITIQLDWGDPRQAYEIVQGALQNFLEARHIQEVTALDEVLTVLSGKAAALRRDLEGAMTDARRRAPVPPRAVLPSAPRLPSEELARLQAQVDSRQRGLQEVEEIRRRRLAELQTQLDQARNTLSSAHPTVVALRRDIESLSYESPQLTTLREDLRVARKAYQDRLAKEGFPVATLGAAPAPSILPPIDLGSREEDPRVRELRVQYESLALQLQTAQVERDAARTAFKYRYNVIWPPQVPREPVSPDPLKIFPAGLVAALLLSILGAAAPDLIHGRIVQRWQVEQLLGLEVLGEIERRA